jgi:hypothetical protein
VNAFEWQIIELVRDRFNAAEEFGAFGISTFFAAAAAAIIIAAVSSPYRMSAWMAAIQRRSSGVPCPSSFHIFVS